MTRLADPRIRSKLFLGFGTTIVLLVAALVAVTIASQPRPRSRPGSSTTSTPRGRP